MSYYDALVAAWNSTTQPPTGVSGQPLTAGMTTQQKCTTINSWTMAGPAVPMVIPTYKVYNLIVIAEFNALTASNQQMVRDILGMGTVDASPGSNIRARMISVFPSGTQTFTNLAALAKNYDNPTQDWCYTNGYPSLGVSGPGNISVSDAQNAGLS